MTRVEDVITRDFVESAVRELVDGDLVYRNLFRGIDATSIGSNAYTFNIAEDDMGRVRVVPEGSEIPRHQSSVRQVTVTFDKYAGEVSLTMEAQEDGLLDMKGREVEDLGRAMDVTLEEEAYSELDSNYKATVGDNDDAMSFADIRDAIIEVRQGHYNPDTLVLDLDAYGDLLTANSFNRATSAGDNLVRTGEVGEVAGLDVVVDNRHNLGSAGHGGYLVDTDRFGYELRRTPMATNRYSDEERMADNIQVYTRRTWKALFPEAAVLIDA